MLIASRHDGVFVVNDGDLFAALSRERRLGIVSGNFDRVVLVVVRVVTFVVIVVLAMRIFRMRFAGRRACRCFGRRFDFGSDVQIRVHVLA